MNQIFKYSLKLFFSLLFVTFASFMVSISFAVIFLQSRPVFFYIITQLFNLIILLCVVCQTNYSIGFKDSNLVKIGHIKEDLYKSFKIGAIAQMPWVIFLFVSVYLNIRFSVYRIFNSAYFGFMTAIAGKSEYMRMSVLKIGGFVIVLLIVPIISGISYILGYKGIDIFSKFIYKKNRGE